MHVAKFYADLSRQDKSFLSVGSFITSFIAICNYI